MPATINRRVAAEIEGDYVLFLIGVRLNKPWKVWRWAPVFAAMPRMLIELARRPELGLLHARTHFGPINTLLVQYWRSAEHLQRYAAARDNAHLPAWRAFNQAVGANGDVGIWHETYLIAAGRSESVYVNMPRYGMGMAGEVFDAVGPRASAGKRLTSPAAAPAPAEVA